VPVSSTSSVAGCSIFSKAVFYFPSGSDMNASFASGGLTSEAPEGGGGGTLHSVCKNEQRK
jgi:hypothetical protein